MITCGDQGPDIHINEGPAALALVRTKLDSGGNSILANLKSKIINQSMYRSVMFNYLLSNFHLKVFAVEMKKTID